MRAVDRRTSEQHFDALTAELDEERAATLGRSGRKIEIALARCARLYHAVRHGHDHGTTRDDVVDAYYQARAAFLEARSDFCIQREAIGLADHRWVDRIYPTPPPL